MTKTEECNKYFVTVQVHFRSASNISVYLANTSAITPANTEVVGDNKSMFGEFSSDYIAGAARVAFLENTESGEVLKNVWIPNENIALSASTNPATLNPNSTTLERFENTVYPYGYMYVEENHVLLNPYTWEDYTNGVASVGSKSLAIPATETTESRINHATPLLTFENTDGKMQTKTLTVRIWVEGTDREADKALVGGKMNYLLNFIGIRKQTNEASLDQFTTDGDGVLKIGGADVAQDLVEYSHDGISWNPYYGVSLKKQGYTEVYVRYVETTFVAPSAPKKIVLPS